MSSDQSKSERRRVVGWLVPRRGKWLRAVARLAVLVCVLFVFRFHVITWLVAGHNLAWKTFTGSAKNNRRDVEQLARLRGPGARMLVRIGEASALSSVRDAGMIPALLDVARSHPDPKVRAYALQGLRRFWDDRILAVAAEGLAHPDPAVRGSATDTIAELGDQRHLPLLRESEQSETDPEVKAKLNRAIGLLPPVAGAPRHPRETVRVAAVQFISEMGQPERNRPRLEKYVRQAAKNGAKIVVLPETAITGYMSQDIRTTWQVGSRKVSDGLRGISPENVAETVPGASTQAFSKLAKELGIYLTIPFLEHEPESGKFFNTVVLAGPDGKLLRHYRKRNPWPYPECSWASPGDRGIQTIDTPYGRLALLICYDINYEPPVLKREKVDTLLYCIAWVDQPKSSWFRAELPRIARRNNINIIGANWTVPKKPDWHGYGQSLILDRTGRALARVTRDVGEEIIYADLPIPESPAGDQ